MFRNKYKILFDYLRRFEQSKGYYVQCDITAVLRILACSRYNNIWLEREQQQLSMRQHYSNILSKGKKQMSSKHHTEENS